jgi:hypothetical protein
MLRAFLCCVRNISCSDWTVRLRRKRSRVLDFIFCSKFHFEFRILKSCNMLCIWIFFSCMWLKCRLCTWSILLCSEYLGCLQLDKLQTLRERSHSSCINIQRVPFHDIITLYPHVNPRPQKHYVSKWISIFNFNTGRSLWACSQTYEMSSTSRTFGSWVPWIPLVYACSFLWLFCCVGSDLATGWFHVQAVLQTVCKIHSFKLHFLLGTEQRS